MSLFYIAHKSSRRSRYFFVNYITCCEKTQKKLGDCRVDKNSNKFVRWFCISQASKTRIAQKIVTIIKTQCSSLFKLAMQPYHK